MLPSAGFTSLTSTGAVGLVTGETVAVRTGVLVWRGVLAGGRVVGVSTIGLVDGVDVAAASPAFVGAVDGVGVTGAALVSVGVGINGVTANVGQGVNVGGMIVAGAVTDLTSVESLGSEVWADNTSVGT